VEAKFLIAAGIVSITSLTAKTNTRQTTIFASLESQCQQRKSHAKRKISQRKENKMKHRHHDMICAKAANMDLVVFYKNPINGEWKEIKSNENSLPEFSEDFEYFACIPQHKEACLHWLNGGMVQIGRGIGCFVDAQPALVYSHKWIDTKWYTLDNYESRIKPRKEKRWIGVIKEQFTKGGRAYYKNTECSYKTIEDLKRDVHAPNGFDDWQFVQIEIEI
jgi:hypothetical protein